MTRSQGRIPAGSASEGKGAATRVPGTMNITISRVEEGYRLETKQRLAASLETVFPFFADAFKLQAITPANLRFRILSEAPIEMRSGTLIDYRLRISGVPVRWRSEITAWDPPFRFVDEQRRGPYRWWIHEHVFSEKDGETFVTDRVDYGVPGGAVVHRFLVGPAVQRIFAYRAKCLQTHFGD
jgi:ligand-binding SRPBCC domain-containing protein